MNTISDTGSKTPVMVFGDDGSASADVACLWIANHRWKGWDLEVITATMPSLPMPDTQAVYREWSSPHERTILAHAGFETLRHLAIERDPRLVFDSRNDASLIVVGDRNEKRPAPNFLGSTAEMARAPSARPRRRGDHGVTWQHCPNPATAFSPLLPSRHPSGKDGPPCRAQTCTSVRTAS